VGRVSDVGATWCKVIALASRDQRQRHGGTYRVNGMVRGLLKPAPRQTPWSCITCLGQRPDAPAIKS
jgi:hypothetical protein